MSIYDANGSFVPDANTFSDIDGICDVKTGEVSGRECVEISQYIWGVSHADGLGLLATDLIWDNGFVWLSTSVARLCIDFFVHIAPCCGLVIMI